MFLSDQQQPKPRPPAGFCVFTSHHLGLAGLRHSTQPHKAVTLLAGKMMHRAVQLAGIRYQPVVLGSACSTHQLGLLGMGIAFGSFTASLFFVFKTDFHGLFHFSQVTFNFVNCLVDLLNVVDADAAVSQSLLKCSAQITF